MKHLLVLKIQKHDGYQRGLSSIVYNLFDKKSKGINNEIKQNEQLAEELHEPIIKKFKRRKVYSSFKYNIWVADLAAMQFTNKFIKEFNFLLCVINIFRKYICC